MSLKYLITLTLLVTCAGSSHATAADSDPQWNSIDAAFGPFGENKDAWFFKGHEFIKYDLSRQCAYPGYPKNINAAFDGMTFTDGIDAAFSSGDTAWFFRGNKFIKYDLTRKRAFRGYPKRINQAFDGMTFTDGIDAAFSSGDTAWFFRGNKFIKYDLTRKRAFRGYPKRINEAWDGMTYTDAVDAAFDYGDGHSRFFRGNTFIKYDMKGKVAVDGYPQELSTAWQGISSPIRMTEVKVHVYKLLGAAPFWHTGTEIDGMEYYFHSDGQVHTTDQPGKFNGHHHRAIVRVVGGTLDEVLEDLTRVKKRWNGTRYSLTTHNCNFFTNDLLSQLDTVGLDDEYLTCSGLARCLGLTPGSANVEEIARQLESGTISESDLIGAYKEDAERVERLPNDIVNETKRAINKARERAKKALGFD